MYKLSLSVFILLFISTGIAHFILIPFFMDIMPPWLPFHKEIVFISGVLEIWLALMLISKKTRKTAAWGLIILLIVVFPANIQMFINYLNEHNPHLWISIIRLPFQPLLIWWAYSFIRPQNIYSDYIDKTK